MSDSACSVLKIMIAICIAEDLLTIRNLLLLQDKECKATKVFGNSQSGVLASYPGETFDLSQIYNLTQSSMKSDGLDLSSLFSNFLDTATPESAAESAASVAASD